MTMPANPQILQPLSDDIDTGRDGSRSQGGVQMTTATLPTIGDHSATIGLSRPTAARRYVAPMGTVTAHDIARELQRRTLGVTGRRLDYLLYYCQGHYAAGTGRALFAEPITVTDAGPTVNSSGTGEHTLGNDELITVEYVLSRYGGSTTHDLRLLTQAETPWHEAVAAGATEIPLDALIRYFREDGAADDPGDDIPIPSAAVVEMAGRARQTEADAKPDDLEKLRRKLVNGG
jgi:uncharacterized phage-associated protein